MDKTDKALIVIAVSLTLSIAFFIHSYTSYINSLSSCFPALVADAGAVDDVAVTSLALTQDAAVDASDPTVDAGLDASASSDSGATSSKDASVVYNVITPERKVRWVCGEPYQTMLGTFVRNCKYVGE
jgi:hypothetical protein